MLSLKQVGVFFTRLVLIYGLLVTIWPIVQGTYIDSFCGVGNVLARPFGKVVRVTLQPIDESGKQMEVELRLENFRAGGARTTRFNARLMGYVPTAETMALIIATPLARIRKWKTLLYGWILANGMIAFNVAFLIVFHLSGSHKAAIFSRGPVWGAILDTIHTILVGSLGFTFVAPILIWMVVTFRKADLASLLDLHRTNSNLGAQ